VVNYQDYTEMHGQQNVKIIKQAVYSVGNKKTVYDIGTLKK